MNQDLLQKYITGDATPEERDEITRWLDADKANMREFLSLRKLYDISIWQKEKVSAKPANGQRSILFRISIELAKVAAVFIIAYLSVTMLMRHKADEPAISMQTVYVPAGQRAELTLTDGTKVWLNAKTTFTFPNNFSGKNRLVTLDGEGYFNVTKNEEKPFTVQTGKYDITVLGTEFNVTAYAGSSIFETDLITGKVEVASPENKKPITLTPNTRIYQENGVLIKDSILHANYFQWREGILSFYDEPVEKIIEKIQLYYDIRIRVENKEIFKNRYSGKFRTKDGVEQVLKVLQLNNKFTYEKNDDLNLITIK